MKKKTEKKLKKSELEQKIKKLKSTLMTTSILLILVSLTALTLLIKTTTTPAIHPKQLHYRYCIENYMYAGYIGKLCCEKDPYQNIQNQCAYYYTGDKIDKPKTYEKNFESVIPTTNET